MILFQPPSSQPIFSTVHVTMAAAAAAASHRNQAVATEAGLTEETAGLASNCVAASSDIVDRKLLEHIGERKFIAINVMARIGLVMI